MAEGDGKVRVQATIFPEELQEAGQRRDRSEQLEMSVLTAEAVAKSYNGRRVVNGVNIEVRGGEIVGLLGPKWRRENHDVSHHGRLGSAGRG